MMKWFVIEGVDCYLCEDTYKSILVDIERYREEQQRKANPYRWALNHWDEYSDQYKDDCGIRPSYSYYLRMAEQTERRQNPNYTEVWRDYYGNQVVVRFVDGKAVFVRYL